MVRSDNHHIGRVKLDLQIGGTSLESYEWNMTRFSVNSIIQMYHNLIMCCSRYVYNVDYYIYMFIPIKVVVHNSMQYFTRNNFVLIIMI